MTKSLNAVVQIITSKGGPAFHNMAAGTGWFVHEKHVGTDMEGTMLTNAHVVRDAKIVFIRLPCNHTYDIPAQVAGISTDLDLAVLRLPEQSLNTVKKFLNDTYGDGTIPTLRIGDSDQLKVTEGAVYVEAKGYPLGTEYQQITRGIFSGLKHANEQVYIVSTSTINPGNSGGPLVNPETGEVLGINSMKMNNAEEINMAIPSNRIKRVLPYLLDNSENLKQVEEWIKLASAAYGDEPSVNQINDIGDMVREAAVTLDADHVLRSWERHSLGGKKRANGSIVNVSFRDWFDKHIHNRKNSHGIFVKVMEHIHNDEFDSINDMRKEGFQSYSCEHCANETHLDSHNNESQRRIVVVNIPPRVLHMPRLAFKTSNTSGQGMLDYLGAPEYVTSGVLVSDVVEGGLMDRSGLCQMDFIYNVTTSEGSYSVDNYGEAWKDELSVSLPLIDIIHRSSFDDTIKLNILRNGKPQEIEIHYKYLEHEFKPHVRDLDSLKDMPLAKQVCNYKGVIMKPLRLDDVYRFRIGKYMNPHRQNDFKIVVLDIDVQSEAFKARNIVPGDILSSINGENVGKTWDDFLQQLTNDTTMFKCERGDILII
jgi:S1-C subfamily serine protease